VKNFNKLVDLVVACGGKDLCESTHKVAGNASYTSTDVATDFVKTIGEWPD